MREMCGCLPGKMSALFRERSVLILPGIILQNGSHPSPDEVIRMDSIWIQTARLPEFNPLRSDLKTDVLIIGGGMAGLLCAYRLAQAGVDYALVEANRIGCGITKNTTAKITSQHGLI